MWPLLVSQKLRRVKEARGTAALLVFWSMKENIVDKEGRGTVKVYLYDVRGLEKLCSSMALVPVVNTEQTLHGLILVSHVKVIPPLPLHNLSKI